MKNLPEDRLERATAAMRNEAVPTGPTEELLNQTIARVGAGEVLGGSKRKEWWTMRVVRRSAAAAGIMILAMAGIVWLMLGRGAGVAFGDVVDRVLQAKAVRCVISADVDVPGHGRQTSGGEILVVEPDWMVDKAGEVKFIMNTRQGKGLMLVEAGKQAIALDNSQAAAKMQQQANLIEQFRRVQGKDGKPLGEKEIDGVKTKGFEATSETGRLEVWADEKTELPVLAVMDLHAGFMPAMTVRFSKFDWNPVYDEKELTLEVPAGYHINTMNLATPTEADVGKMLEEAAAMNGGEFPDHLGMMEITQSLAKNLATKVATMPAEQRDAGKNAIMEEATKASQLVGRGWAFMADKTHGSDWHYAGKDVKQGEKGKAVLWYKPQGKETYRVFDADLTVHDAKAGELPAGGGEEVKMNLAPPGATQGK